MNSPRVLIVDDDEGLLEALPQALRLRMGDIQVDTCAAATEALRQIQQTDYDTIVSDIKMPGMDGLALLTEIRQLRPTTPTLLITGHGEHDLAVQALRGGAYDFVQKPIDRDYFVASLSRAIEMRRLDRQVEEQKLALEQHARVLDHVGDGVVLVDPGGRIQLWNPAAEAITGLAAEAVRGRAAAEVLGGWDQVAPRVPVAEAPGSAIQPAATVPVEIGQRELWLSVSGVEFGGGTVYAFRNVTEERALEELKGDFVATVSHELRTPLAAIYGSAETLLRDQLALPGETRERLLTIISEESARLTRIVTDILLTSNLDSNRLRLSQERVDVAQIVRSVAESFEPKMLEKGGTIDVRLSGATPVATTDGDKLRQVLINVIENAVKYSPQASRVEIRLEAEAGTIRVVVRDEGPGIPRQEHKRIFGKFYRLDPNLTEGVGGTGLGLYICRALLRRMGGRISVASAEGEGSTFVIELPVLPSEIHMDSEPAVQHA